MQGTILSTDSKVLQLFRESCRKKVHATIPKGIVGGFEFSVLQRNLKELARKAMEMCFRVLKESNKSRFDSYSGKEQCIDHIPYYLSGLSRAHFFRQPFWKKLYTNKPSNIQMNVVLERFPVKLLLICRSTTFFIADWKGVCCWHYSKTQDNQIIQNFAIEW